MIKLLSFILFFLATAFHAAEIEEEEELLDDLDDMVWNSGDTEASDNDLVQAEQSNSILEVHTTPFFTIEKTIENSDAPDGEIDVFGWRSTQRIVFTLTNPVDTH